MTAPRMRQVLFSLASALAACGGDGPRDAGARRDAGRDAGVDAGYAPPFRCDPIPSLPAPLDCNGHAALCDRRLDQVAFPTAHNAMSSEEEGWIPPNQTYRLARQLTDGVRGFMLDVYEDGSATRLCHAICPLGSRPFVHALADVRAFAECHPSEVITLILESHVDEARVVAAFEAAALIPLLHAQPLGAPWPTLREMIESGRRVVVFTERSETTAPWHHPLYAHGFDNDYANESVDDFDCAVLRGAAGNAIFVLNHFLTAPVAMRSLAEMANEEAVLLDHAQRCQAEHGRLPNFVTVDFVDVGGLFPVVDTLNGF